jgi:outer membrane protein W
MEKFPLFAALLFIAVPASAQTEASALTSFGFGRSEAQGTVFRTPHLGVTINQFWGDNWSTELGLFRSEEIFETFDRDLSPSVRLERHDLYPVTGAVQYHFFDSRWRPYIGVGMIYAAQPRELRNETLLDEGDILRLMLNLGLTYSFTERLGLRVDLRYTPLGFSGPPVLEGLTPTLGLKVRF